MAQRYVLIVINNGVFLVNPIDHYPSALLRGLTIDSIVQNFFFSRGTN